MSKVLKKFVQIPFNLHLAVGTIIRLALITYADYHDSNYDVPYTDVDYKVFTDAARHVIIGNSPYKRHTYRYSPLIAYLMTFNILINKDFGKMLFSFFDLLVTIAVKNLVSHQIGKKNSDIPKYCSLFWLYNPIAIAISTRGNADSVPCFLVILSIYVLLTDSIKKWKHFISGVLLGFSIHLRLYPLAFSFPMYLSLSDNKIYRRTPIKEGLIALIPNKKQIVLALGCIFALIVLTVGMYMLYGYEFLFETYIYHLFRKDTKHNFSVLFYYSYLTMDHLTFDIVKYLCQIFEVLILLFVSLAFGCEFRTLPFSLFCQSVVLVAFNSVMTSQYFVWFLSLLPLVVQDFEMSLGKAFLLTLVWFVAQLAWLFPAYLLEFKCREVFTLIWIQGIIFFWANVSVLSNIIKSYNPGYCFGKSQKYVVLNRKRR